MKRIDELKAILADRKLLLGVIRKEIIIIRDKYGDERRTAIGFDEFDISMEDLIPRENIVITMTKLGYIKRMTVDTFKSQNRGGKGIKGMQTIALHQFCFCNLNSFRTTDNLNHFINIIKRNQ